MKSKLQWKQMGPSPNITCVHCKEHIQAEYKQLHIRIDELKKEWCPIIYLTACLPCSEAVKEKHL
jgi:hypothetical protein